jgi:dipeptidyl-peptidase 4
VTFPEQLVTFPEQYARTRRFTAGVPRDFTVSPDGRRVLFCRSASGDDPALSLFLKPVSNDSGGADGERLVADPGVLEVDRDAVLPSAERALRERGRERGTGITGYATDSDVRIAVFSLEGRLWAAEVDSGRVRELPAVRPVVDPRPSPGGDVVAYVADGALRVIGADGTGDRALATPEKRDVAYGLAEFVAAEDMNRTRGHWWAPDGDRLAVARVDNGPVQEWYLADPADPGTPPTSIRYPMAGTTNAEVTLWILGLDGSRIAVEWDRAQYEYLLAVHWSRSGLIIAVQNRSHTVLRILDVNLADGTTTVRREDRDPAWVQPAPGVPTVTGTGALVWTVEVDDTRRLFVDDLPVTPVGLQVDQVFDVDGDTVLFGASEESTEIHLWSWSPSAGLTRLTSEPGVYEGRLGGGTLVVSARTLDSDGVTVTAGDAVIASNAEVPVVTPRASLSSVGDREIRTAVLFPTGYVPGTAKLPVLLNPYGGPGGRRVFAAKSVYLADQWFADQGFVVVVADGRGTPGRGPGWARTVHHDKSDAALEDQIVALHAVAERHPDLDLNRVAIRGWSYGGYLAALAVLRRPDVFHVAVAGAAPTDLRLYNTYYQERYLGHPDEFPEVYERGSIIDDAPNLSRPLMLIHGLLDDNVLAAHTLRLSAALLAAGRPHTVLPVSGASHMADQPHLLTLQLDFLNRALRPE